MQESLTLDERAAPSALMHRLRALRAVVGRELGRFLRQPSRLGSALVRPLLWFVVFSAGFNNVFGVAIVPPYETYIEYKAYMVPGLLGMVALFNGMQSSLSMVYDREMGVMRLLLTAPLARGWLLAFKLLAGTSLSLLQMAVFLLIAWLLGSRFELVHAPGLLLRGGHAMEGVAQASPAWAVAWFSKGFIKASVCAQAQVAGMLPGGSDPPTANTTLVFSGLLPCARTT